MIQQFTKSDVTLELITAVEKYLELRAIAEFLRDEVNSICVDILKNEIAMYSTARPEHNIKSERIFDPALIFTCDDEIILEQYYNLCDKAEREAGIKPDAMKRDFCPALVAENNQIKAEQEIIDTSAKMLDLEFDGKTLNNRLLYESNGLERRQEWIDLNVGLVVNL